MPLIRSFNYLIEQCAPEKNYFDTPKLLRGLLFNNNNHNGIKEYVRGVYGLMLVYIANNRAYIANNTGMHRGITSEQLLGVVLPTKNIPNQGIRVDITFLLAEEPTLSSLTDQRAIELSRTEEARLIYLEASTPPLVNGEDDDEDDDDEIDLDDDD